MANSPNRPAIVPPADAPTPKPARKAKARASRKPSASSRPVRVRCKQTGFKTAIKAKDWNAYTDAQRAAYEVLG